MSVWSGFAVRASNDSGQQNGWFESPSTLVSLVSGAIKQLIDTSEDKRGTLFSLGKCPVNITSSMQGNTAGDQAFAAAEPSKPACGGRIQNNRQRTPVAGYYVRHWRWGR